MSGQTDHETDTEGPLQNPLSEDRPPHQGQVVAHPGEHRVTRQVLETSAVRSLSGLCRERTWRLGRSRFRSHLEPSCQQSSQLTATPSRSLNDRHEADAGRAARITTRRMHHDGRIRRRPYPGPIA